MMIKASIYVAQGRPAGDRWCLHLEVDGQIDQIEGFPDFFDAWAFAVAHGLPDPVGNHPGGNAKLSTLRPPEIDNRPTQRRLL